MTEYVTVRLTRRQALLVHHAIENDLFASQTAGLLMEARVAQGAYDAVGDALGLERRNFL